MEKVNLDESVLFLEECLNNRSKVIFHQTFTDFLYHFSKAIKNSSMEIVVKAKPNGERCMHCKSYIPRIFLQESIKMNSENFMCSIECLKNSKIAEASNIQKKDYEESQCSGLELLVNNIFK